MSSYLAGQQRGTEGSIFDLSFLIGTWTGERHQETEQYREVVECSWGLSNQFIEMRADCYQGENKVSEVRSLFSYDRTKRLYRVRKFFPDGGIAEFNGVADPNRRQFVFRRISGENLHSSVELREVYRLLSQNDLEVLVEVSTPGGPFQSHSQSHMARNVIPPIRHGEVL